MERAPARSMWGGGDAYERYAGRWSRLVGREVLAWLDAAPGGNWLDAGCGTGALTELILEREQPRSVLGVDPAQGFLDHARAHIADPLASFVQGDAMALPIGDNSVDVVISGLVLNFVPDPDATAREFARVTRPGGTVAAYVWDYRDGMEMMRRFWDAALAVDPGAQAEDQGTRFAHVCQPDALERIFTVGGLRSVVTRDVTIPMRFRDLDDFWLPFLGGTGVAPAYLASCDDETSTAIRDRLLATLPIDTTGAIQLQARAFAVRGIA